MAVGVGGGDYYDGNYDAEQLDKVRAENKLLRKQVEDKDKFIQFLSATADAYEFKISDDDGDEINLGDAIRNRFKQEGSM